MSQRNECWLWHKRMGHVNFDSMIKISNFKAMRDLLKIIKPIDTVFRECQLGK